MFSTLTRRLYLLLALLALGLGTIYLLPEKSPLPAAGVATELPDFVEEWYGRDAAVSERERNILGGQTRFARKLYTDGRGNAIYVSIVFSGEDMSVSIHRPERCLPAQGFVIIDSQHIRVPLTQPEPALLGITRLHTRRFVFDPSGKPVITKDNRQLTEYALSYYWFIGARETIASHLPRYLMDTRDRILHGTTQSWAYITVTSAIRDFTGQDQKAEAEADAVLQGFIRKLIPMIQKPGLKIRD